MQRGYLAGMWPAGTSRRFTVTGLGSVPAWAYRNSDIDGVVYAAGDGLRLFAWDGLALLVRGQIRGRAGTDLEALAEELRYQYLEQGTLAVDGLDGSFTLALLDAAGRVVLYRNLVGTGFTYYHLCGDGLVFGSNLADLVHATGGSAQPNRDVLPSFFLYRWCPGRDTLFDGFYRLLPGEEVCWGTRGLVRRQRHTFANLSSVTIHDDAVERVETVLSDVLLDCARLRPDAANLLSGGIDSSYLQALWGCVSGPANDLPRSFSVDVDHPTTWQDTDYAITASRWLGTRHTLIGANDPYAGYLLETLATTGEPPNHVQTAYFGALARAMVEAGTTAGLCGEGADSLFGLCLANQVHNAGLLQALLPGRWLRALAAGACGLAGMRRLAATFRLANHDNDLDYPLHPVNHVAAFADWQAVEACFGTNAVRQAAQVRHDLLELYRVKPGPMDRLHATGFLCEAVDSASLWATLFDRAGAELLCPFLDSRVLRLVLSLPDKERWPFRRPKELLRRALARHAPAQLACRAKLGFGQPIFEWLGPGGQLRPLVEQISEYAFVDRAAWQRTQARPTWFLYSLLCYDLWHKLFIERSLQRPDPAEPTVVKTKEALVRARG